MGLTMKRATHAGIALSIAVVCLCASGTARAATPTPDEVMTAAGLSARQKQAVLSGEVVSLNVERIAPNEVVSLVVTRFPKPLAEVFPRYSRGQDIEASRHFLVVGEVDPASPAMGWEKARFDASDMDEVEKLIAAAPGLDFNLSAAEIAELREQLAGVGEAERVQRVSEVHRGLLQRRMQAYVEKGLDGIAPYAREKGESTSVADEIRRVWMANEFILERFPRFSQALESFPNDQPPEMHNEFFWVKQRFESQWTSRPAFTLEHAAWFRGDDYILISSRQFYVGHAYNANQGLTLVLPYEGEVIVFHQMDVTSDLAARYVTWIALPIAQKIMRSELERFYRGIQAEARQ